MSVIVVESVLGFHAFDGDRLVDNEPYPRDVYQVTDKLFRLGQGGRVEELDRLVERLSKNGYKELVVSSVVAASVARRFSDLKFAVDSQLVARQRGSKFGLVLRSIGISREEYFRFKREVGLELSRLKIRAAQAKRDLSVVQAINAIDELDKSINTLVSRLREWYGLYFPEMEHIVKDNELYAKIVSDVCYREEMSVELLERVGLKRKVAERLVDAAERSVGAELAEEDLAEARRLAHTVLQLYSIRRAMERYVDKTMMEVAPNIRGLVGSTIGARLIALAGGLEKLAMLPASTIQVLGAEKALFRALRYGSKPPKHGVIYQYPAVHLSPRWQRGKIARAVAGKLAIAARIDLFTGRDVSSKLRRELNERIQVIKKTFSKPPAKKVEAKPQVKKGKVRKKKKRKRKKKR